MNKLQDTLTFNLTEKGNTAIYGSSDSGKELLLTSIVYDSYITHSSDEVNFYILNFGSETLRKFKEFPHVGDVVLSDDSEKIMRLFKMLKQEIKVRKQKLIQNFRKKIALQIIGGNYSYIFSKARRKKPSSFRERGLVTINDDTVYDFKLQGYVSQRILMHL